MLDVRKKKHPKKKTHTLADQILPSPPPPPPPSLPLSLVQALLSRYSHHHPFLYPPGAEQIEDTWPAFIADENFNTNTKE